MINAVFGTTLGKVTHRLNIKRTTDHNVSVKYVARLPVQKINMPRLLIRVTVS